MSDLLNSVCYVILLIQSKPRFKILDMKLKISPLLDVKPSIVNQFRLLNFHRAGLMLNALVTLVEQDQADIIMKDAVVFYITDSNERVAAWSLAYKHAKMMHSKPRGFYYSKISFYVRAHFYTKISERGKGYGSRLAKAVRKHYSEPVYGHTASSTIFKRHQLG